MRTGGIVLCGGKSRRMGWSKADLPFGPERMLQRVVRLLGEVVDPIVVVAAAQQELPELPGQVIVARDEHEGQGPLEGLGVGLRVVRDHADAAYVTSCDVPLLVPEFVRQMIQLLGGHDVAVPLDGSFHHPLAAVYRVSVLEHVADLLEANQRRPVALYERVATLRVPLDELRSVDRELATLANLNGPQDYLRALHRAGFVPTPDWLQKLQSQAAIPGEPDR